MILGLQLTFVLIDRFIFFTIGFIKGGVYGGTLWIKIDFVAKAKDLSQNGFVLKGARLDYVNRRNAASIVYQIQGHIINLFIFPTKEKDMLNSKTMQNRG